MKEHWNERYSVNGLVYGDIPNEYFTEFIRKVTPGTLLLPAEGEGRNAVFAAQQGFKVYAVDFSEVAREKALRKAKNKNVKILYENADIRYWNTDIKFNYIAIIYMHLLPDFRSKVHKKMVDILSPGGQIILEVFSKNQIKYKTGGPQNPDMLYNKQVLHDDFKNLDIKEILEKEINLDEGEFHKGKASIIQMKAEKTY
ncbi:MAG: class I SAM-dependent methyltransferase [Bacteroidales bacterium]|nr:class I SAM-dependent methyltransferase [Bacteroidales bacterium]